MSITRAIRKYLEGARIYYKTIDDDKIHTITPLNYRFLRHKIFTTKRWSEIDRIKDNIEYIHFYKSGNFGSYSAGPNTDVTVTLSKRSYKNLYIEDSENVTLKIVDGDNCVFVSKINQATSIKYSCFTISTRGSIEIHGANYTSIHTNGNDMEFHNLHIDSRLLEINNAKITVYNGFVYEGDKLKLENVQGPILYQYVHTARVVATNSQIEANTGNYDIPVSFGLKNSRLAFYSRLELGEVTLKNKGGIMLTEDTVDIIEKGVRDYEKKKQEKEKQKEEKVAKLNEQIRSTSSSFANVIADLEQQKKEIYASTYRALKDQEQEIGKKYQKCIGNNTTKNN